MQFSLGSIASKFGIYINFFPALFFSWGLKRSSGVFVASAFFVGLILDIISVSFFGTYTLAYAIGALFCSAIIPLLDMHRVSSRVFAIVAGLAGYSSVLLMMSFIGGFLETEYKIVLYNLFIQTGVILCIGIGVKYVEKNF